MAAVRIVLLSIAAAVLYGIVHDQITARVCLEYFTLFHPRLPVPQTPTMLGLAWGVIATWWVGLGLGIPLALAARAGRWPTISAREIVLPLSVLLVALLVLALMALAMGWAGSVGEVIPPPTWIAEQLPRERWRYFVAAWCAHQASYGFGTLLGLALCGHVVLLRWRRARTGGDGAATAAA